MMSRIVAIGEAAGSEDLADLQWFWHHKLEANVTIALAIA
jgi:hypothetical protein